VSLVLWLGRAALRSFAFVMSLSLPLGSRPYSRCSAGELKPAEIDKVLDVISKPEDYKVRALPQPSAAPRPPVLSFPSPPPIRYQIPRYFLNRQRDWKEGNSLQVSTFSPSYSFISQACSPTSRLSSSFAFVSVSDFAASGHLHCARL
jgi:hypothetical protein